MAKTGAGILSRPWDACQHKRAMIESKARFCYSDHSYILPSSALFGGHLAISPRIYYKHLRMPQEPISATMTPSS